MAIRDAKVYPVDRVPRALLRGPSFRRRGPMRELAGLRRRGFESSRPEFTSQPKSTTHNLKPAPERQSSSLGHPSRDKSRESRANPRPALRSRRSALRFPHWPKIIVEPTRPARYNVGWTNRQIGSMGHGAGSKTGNTVDFPVLQSLLPPLSLVLNLVGTAGCWRRPKENLSSSVKLVVFKNTLKMDQNARRKLRLPRRIVQSAPGF